MNLRGYAHITKQLKPTYSAETVTVLAVSAEKLKMEGVFRTKRNFVSEGKQGG